MSSFDANVKKEKKKRIDKRNYHLSYETRNQFFLGCNDRVKTEGEFISRDNKGMEKRRRKRGEATDGGVVGQRECVYARTYVTQC